MKQLFTFLLLLFAVVAGAQSIDTYDGSNDRELVSVTLQGQQSPAITTDATGSARAVFTDSLMDVSVKYQNLTAAPQDSFKLWVFIERPNDPSVLYRLAMNYNGAVAPTTTRNFYVGTPNCFGRRGTYKLTALLYVYDRATQKESVYASQFSITNLRPTPLPVTLVRFTAAAVNRMVRVDWTTATELSFSHFVVERSANGSDFSPVQQVTAKGPGSYQVTDALPDLTGTYYRLKSVDLDGTYVYTAPVFVKSTQGLKGEVLVQSFDRREVYAVRADKNAVVVRYTVRDLRGRVVYHQAPTGRIEHNLTTAGVYVLTLEGSNGVVGSTRLIIR